MTGRRAGIYARISRDDGEALGVARQVADCEAEAERRGWTVTARYLDNNVSASTKKPRPEYQRMLADAEDGRIDAVICWDVDRLTRKPAELESFIDLADRHQLALASVGGEIDLATPQGRLTARIKGSVARHEAEQMGRRIARKHEQNAMEGLSYGGPAPFGYERVDAVHEGRRVKTLVPREDEAQWVRDAYRRLLGGESLWAITQDMRRAGVVGRRGKEIKGNMLGHILRRPVYAGKRTWHGEMVGDGIWEPLVSWDDYQRAQAILNAPGRFHTRGTAPKYLLSGIALCGRCGGKLRPRAAGRQKRKPTYGCPDCTRVTRSMAPVDATVTAVIIARLEQLGLNLNPGESGEYPAAVAARDALVARMDNAADEYADGHITARQLARINERLKADIARAEDRMRRAAPDPAVADAAGPGARAAWEASPLEQKRNIIRALCDVTVLPSGPGVKFDPDQVKIEWRS